MDPVTRTLPDTSGIIVGDEKATPEMQRSLSELHRALLCPLCNAIFQSPMTSSCGHSFCQSCIDSYNRDNYNCPVKGCGLPLSMRSRGKSYRQLNPALSTVVSSYEAIVHELAAAPHRWWDIDPDAYQTTQQQKGSEMVDLADVNTSPAVSRHSEKSDDTDEDDSELELL